MDRQHVIKYYDDKEENGIKYDLKLIEKEFKKLNVPNWTYQINFKALGTRWSQILSERSAGKTTNILLLGMVFNKIYGTQLCYIRQKRDMVSPSKSMTMFDTIIKYDNGKYIRMLTDGEYNNIKYHWKKYYFTKTDEKGNIEKQDKTPFMYAMSVDDNFNYKSSFNNPLADFVVFDEFIGKTYAQNECVDFMDLVKTIIRDRRGSLIFMLANTINVNSTYFKEFEISRQVKKMRLGTWNIFTTPLGTKIYVEIAKNEKAKPKKKISNMLYFGFRNPKLVSITGEGEDAWAFNQVPHIVKFIDGEKIEKRLIEDRVYIELANEMLQLEFKYANELGPMIEVHPATYKRDEENCIIFTENDAFNDAYNKFSRLKMGSRIYSIIMRMYKYNKIYFSDNETGAMFYDYINKMNERY